MESPHARRSTRELRALFAAADCPAPPALAGRLAAEIVGPWPVRAAAPVVFRLTGLGDWWGKDLRATAAGDGLAGHNLAGPGGERRTLPLSAAIGPSRTDGAPAVLVRYPADAPWPWRRVVDELRVLPDGTVLGLTFGLPAGGRGGAPFLLHPEAR